MKPRASRCLLLGILAAGLGVADVAYASADAAGGEANPYAVISDRNVFHLTPPPAPPAAEQTAADVPKLLLSGFYKVGGNTRVLLSMPAKDAKSVAKYFNLAAGERETAVEVVQINAEKGEVDIINSGARMTLSLARDGVVANGAPGHAAASPPAKSGKLGAHAARMVSPPAAAAPGPIGGNVGGVSSGEESGNGLSYGGAVVAGRNSLGGGNSVAPTATGNGFANGNVIVAGGSLGGAAATAVYVPPNPGSAAANAPGANVGDALMNPQNSEYQPPPRPSASE